MTRLLATVTTHRGLIRDTNQDAVAIGAWVSVGRRDGVQAVDAVDGVDIAHLDVHRSGPVTVVLADGMGGHADGEVASRLAVETVSANPDRMTGDGIREVLDEINVALAARGAKDRRPDAAGCTIAGITVDDQHAWIFNVGDSRVYRVVDGYLGQLSVDDRPPTDSRSQARTSTLTQCLGGSRDLRSAEPHRSTVALRTGESFLLCTDGLSDYVSPTTIRAALTEHDAVGAVHAMLDAALATGAPDNLSIILVTPCPPEGPTDDGTCLVTVDQPGASDAPNAPEAAQQQDSPPREPARGRWWSRRAPRTMRPPAEPSLLGDDR